MFKHVSYLTETLRVVKELVPGLQFKQGRLQQRYKSYQEYHTGEASSGWLPINGTITFIWEDVPSVE